VISYSRGDLLAKIHQVGRLNSLENLESGMQISALVPAQLAHQLNLAKV
jgi:hypothetical protein